MLPRCQPARCKALPAPPQHGMVVAPEMWHGATGVFHCRDGEDNHKKTINDLLNQF